jgi:predicted nucleotidyltransferase
MPYFANNMNTAELIEKLKQEKPILSEKFSVEEIAIFGSYARNTQTDASDIDLLVKLKEPKINNLAGLLNYLEEKLKKHIDITTKHKYLTPRFLSRLEKEIIYV